MFRRLRTRPATGPEAADSAGPEVAPVGPHATDSNRDALGRFRPGNLGHLIHGADSAQLVRLDAPLKQQAVEQILRDRGYGNGIVPTRPYLTLVQHLAGSSLILEHIETFLTDNGGPISAKGRTKRALQAYLQVLDRVMRLAALVGVERVERPVTLSTREWLEAQAETEATDDGSTTTMATEDDPS